MFVVLLRLLLWFFCPPPRSLMRLWIRSRSHHQGPGVLVLVEPLLAHTQDEDLRNIREPDSAGSLRHTHQGHVDFAGSRSSADPGHGGRPLLEEGPNVSMNV
ncbi:uncharacterized protein V6R79_009090 [Siganus canaliculatus]